MRKKNLIMMVVAGILLLAALGSVLLLLILHEPGFYARAAVAPGPTRQEDSRVCFSKFFKLGNCWVDGHGNWDVKFKQTELNSFFEEEFVRLGDAEILKRHGISEPRVVLEKDRIRLAFRYGTKPWSTIFSIDFKVWLAPNDVNVVAVEILGRHFGALPVSAQSLCEVLSELGRQKNIEVTWYRHNNHPVALLRFQVERTRPTAQLLRLSVDDNGTLVIGGRSLDSAQLHPANSPLQPRESRVAARR
jgi:hypothetical protein